jgi:hypothetical protein
MRAAQIAGITLENKKMRFLSGMVKRTCCRLRESVAMGQEETSLATMGLKLFRYLEVRQ